MTARRRSGSSSEAGSRGWGGAMPAHRIPSGSAVPQARLVKEMSSFSTTLWMAQASA